MARKLPPIQFQSDSNSRGLHRTVFAQSPLPGTRLFDAIVAKFVPKPLPGLVAWNMPKECLWGSGRPVEVFNLELGGSAKQHGGGSGTSQNVCEAVNSLCRWYIYIIMQYTFCGKHLSWEGSTACLPSWVNEAWMLRMPAGFSRIRYRLESSGIGNGFLAQRHFSVGLVMRKHMRQVDSPLKILDPACFQRPQTSCIWDRGKGEGAPLQHSSKRRTFATAFRPFPCKRGPCPLAS